MSSKPRSILDLWTGGGAPDAERSSLIIGEVAQAHDGSLGMAHAFVDAIADAGADAVKFQTHLASFESTRDEPWRTKFSRQDASRYEYWKRMEFTEDQWCGLRRHAEDRGLIFLSSPFSVEAADLLLRVGVSAWKVASGETPNSVLLNHLLGSGLPLLVSTGMSPLGEIDKVVHQILEYGNPFALLQCTTSYPCPPESVGVNLLALFRERYGCPVGLSDHSGTIFAGLAALALGASVIEVHVTLSREMFGPDVHASITSGELRQLVKGAAFIESMLRNPVDKDLAAADAAPLRAIFTKSVVAARRIPAGTILQAADLVLKKPGTGIPSDKMHTLIGRITTREIEADSMIQENDLEA